MFSFGNNVAAPNDFVFLYVFVSTFKQIRKRTECTIIPPSKFRATTGIIAEDTSDIYVCEMKNF